MHVSQTDINHLLELDKKKAIPIAGSPALAAFAKRNPSYVRTRRCKGEDCWALSDKGRAAARELRKLASPTKRKATKKKRASKKRSTKKRATKKRSTKKRATKKRSTKRSTKRKATKKRAPARRKKRAKKRARQKTLF